MDLKEVTIEEMGMALESVLNVGITYSETDIRAVLFGSRTMRERAGFPGECGPRWTGLNRGEQQGVLDELVRHGAVKRGLAGSPRNSRYVYHINKESK